MKTKLNQIAIFSAWLWVVLSLSACEKEIPFNGDAGKSEIVINSLNTAGEPISASLYRSVPITLSYYGGAIQLTDAQVEISEENGQSEIMVSSQNLYTSDMSPIPGKTYTIRVAHPDYEETAEGEFTVPYAPELVYTELGDFQTGTNVEGFRKTRFQIKNPRGIANYYSINFVGTTETGEPYTLDFSSFDPKLQYADYEAENGEKFFYGKALASDAGFENEDMEFEINITSPFTALDSITLVVSAIPRDYYLYLLTVKEQEASGWDPFSEPGIVSNQIRNGIGLFSVQTPHFHTWVID